MTDTVLQNKMYSLISHYQNIKDENDAIDEIVAGIVKEQENVTKSQVKKAAKIAFKNKITEAQDELNSFEQFLARIKA